MKTKLNLSERTSIAIWKSEGVKIREIARRLKRHHATILRELERNKFRIGVYEPMHAQRKADGRKPLAWKAKQPLKSKKIYKYVTQQLREGWSLDVISGRLREQDHVDDKSWQICAETIYQFCYKKDNQKPKDKQYWWEYLRWKRKKRKKQNGRSVQRIRIPDRISIHDRPKEINDRKIFGHWRETLLLTREEIMGSTLLTNGLVV